MRTLVVGAGVSGRAASALAAALGDEVMIYDRNPEAVTRAATSFPTASGEWSPELLARAERVVVSPGVPQHAPEVRDALAEGIPVISEVELAASVARAPIVAVTGTNGKTTVTSLIAEMLITAGRKAVATGNIGTAFAEVVLGEWDVFVVEVSSFQLFLCHDFRPHVGAVLNLTPDHLDWHPGYDHYVAAKRNLFARQEPQDAAVLNAGDPEVVRQFRDLPAEVFAFRDGATSEREHMAKILQRAHGMLTSERDVERSTYARRGHDGGLHLRHVAPVGEGDTHLTKLHRDEDELISQYEAVLVWAIMTPSMASTG